MAVVGDSATCPGSQCEFTFPPVPAGTRLLITSVSAQLGRTHDTALSKQIGQFEAADYVAVRKGHVRKRSRTWLSITVEGRVALNHHLAGLDDIVNGIS